MLESLLRSASCERVLIFLVAREEGYAREIASLFTTSLAPIQKQLDKLETGGCWLVEQLDAPGSMSLIPAILFSKS